MIKAQKVTRLQKLGYDLTFCAQSGQVIAKKLQNTYLFNSVNHAYNLLKK